MPFRLDPSRDRKLTRLVKRAAQERFLRRAVVWEREEAARHLYVVREGHLRLTLPPPGDARARTVAVVGPEEMAGEEALLSGLTRRYGARAGEAVVLSVLDGAEVLRTFRTARRSYDAFLRALQEDLGRARAAALRAAGPSTRERLAGLLLDLADRFGEENGRRIRISHWFTHQELADLIGGHRSTVTTALNDWLYEGILEDGDGLIIRHRKVLAALASSPGGS